MGSRHNEVMLEFLRLNSKLQHLSLAQLLARGESRQLDLTFDEGSVLSQNGEDGVLLEIFHRVGTTNQFFVEIGAQASESTSLLLADAFGWAGVFFEADDTEREALTRKYAGISTVRVVGGFVTRENVDSLMHSAGVPEEIDIMTIHISGNDYWLFEALNRVRPRVVVIQINSSIPPGQKLVQPYRPERAWDKTEYFGASFDAMRDLAGRKGYRLVHVEVSGNNAFFVQEVLVGTSFPSESEVRRRAVNYFFRGQIHPPRGSDSKYLDLDVEPRAQDNPS
jgi:hypothetical protein